MRGGGSAGSKSVRGAASHFIGTGEYKNSRLDCISKRRKAPRRKARTDIRALLRLSRVYSYSISTSYNQSSISLNTSAIGRAAESLPDAWTANSSVSMFSCNSQCVIQNRMLRLRCSGSPKIADRGYFPGYFVAVISKPRGLPYLPWRARQSAPWTGSTEAANISTPG